MPKPRILIAAGGTGGHLFPAQACGEELIQKNVEVLFAGAGLKTNRFFQTNEFAFAETSEAKRSVLAVMKGIFKSFSILRKFRPDAVVGFGSFHSFPLLVAARCLRIPIVLFESNSFPGKVNRWFSKNSVLSCVQFAEAARYLKGKTEEVKTPLWRKSTTVATAEEARRYFSLDPDLMTILVFGGSQGAVAINRYFCEAVENLKVGPFQVLHFIGKKDVLDKIQKRYSDLKIRACVKEFEEKMPIAFKAASFAVCRSGAATLAELIAFEVPAVLIPYPLAAEDHQLSNAEFLTAIGGALCLRESDLNPASLGKALETLALHLDEKKTAILKFKNHEHKQELSSIIYDIICKKTTTS